MHRQQPRTGPYQGYRYVLIVREGIQTLFFRGRHVRLDLRLPGRNGRTRYDAAGNRIDGTHRLYLTLEVGQLHRERVLFSTGITRTARYLFVPRYLRNRDGDYRWGTRRVFHRFRPAVSA